VRRFLIWRRSDVTGVSGTGVVAEGCQFDDGCAVVRWRGTHVTTTVHADMGSVEHIHTHHGATRLLWVDGDHNGPRPCKIIGRDGERDGVSRPCNRLIDGWTGESGAIDVNGTPLWTGQRVRCLRGHGELSDVGDVIDIYDNNGQLMVGLYGISASPSAVNIEEVLALETSRGQTKMRNGGKKPSYGWYPVIKIDGNE